MTVDAPTLFQDVHMLAEVLDGMDIGSEVFTMFTCREIEILADVLRDVDEWATADRIIRWHGQGDHDPEDSHHEYYGSDLY